MRAAAGSLDTLRVYDLACWSLGADGTTKYRVAQVGGLPDDRAKRCAGEYANLERAFR